MVLSECLGSSRIDKSAEQCVRRLSYHPIKPRRFALQSARRTLQCVIRKAKSDWIFKQLGRVNDGICGASGSKAAWTAIKTLKRGLGPSKRPPPARMKLPDGTFASSAEENAEVFVKYFEKLYNSAGESIYDEIILPNLPLRATAQGLDHTPSKLEMLEAIGKLHDSAPGASGLRASAWKALAGLGYDSSADAIYGFITNFWESEQLPESWAIGLLSILPTKGDLSLPGNYRGITKLEVAYKIIAQILLLARLKVIKESKEHLDHENQCVSETAEDARTDHSQSKHFSTRDVNIISRLGSFFGYLVKAFDMVPRELLWNTLERFGVPLKLISVLRAMHKSIEVVYLRLMESNVDSPQPSGSNKATC